MTTHFISILSEFKMSSYGPYSIHRCEDTLSINCAINYTLLKAVPNVQRRELVIGTRAAGLGSK